MSDDDNVKNDVKKNTTQVLETIIEDMITTIEASNVDSPTNVEKSVVDTNDKKLGGSFPQVSKDQATQSAPVEEILTLKKQLKAVTIELSKYKIREELSEKEENDKKNRVPDIAIIVPYRDRASQRSAFTKIMPQILKGKNYKIFFVHQRDRRPFNRGGMKNLGFLYLKLKYPNHYKNMTMVFHDVDIMPWEENQFSYQTRVGIVNHFYGFPYALGGIFAIKGVDFETINGFPNIWTWGLEDNIIQARCLKYGIRINRREFVNIQDDNKNIISLWHGWDRLISPNIEPKWKNDKGVDGLRMLRNVRMDEETLDDNCDEINVKSFETGESLSSPFVRNARMRNARNHVRQNQPVMVQHIKRGTANHFGGGRGLRRMMLRN